MKARVSYNDLLGSVAADIADPIGKNNSGLDNLKAIGRFFKLDEQRFTVVGLSIFGTDEFMISLICVDRERSTEENEYIVKMSIDVDSKEILERLFKSLEIVLHDKYDEVYVNKDYDTEVNYSDYH